MTDTTKAQILDLARKAINTELLALKRMKETVGDNFADAVEMILSGQGKCIVTGMGKSGLVGRKIAATLAYKHAYCAARFSAGIGICASSTAMNISTQPIYSRADMDWCRTIAPAMTANTLSRLSRIVTPVGFESFCARICSV